MEATSNEESTAKEKRKFTLKEKCQIVIKNITVEPILMCFDIPNVITGLAMQHLNLEKGCRVDLAFPTNVCDAIAVHNETGYLKEQEAEVQKYVATAMAWRNLLESVIPSLLIIFLGSWSDRHARRKPCIIIPLLGQVTMTLGLAISTYYFYELGIMFNVFVEGLPPAITGSWHSLDMAVFAYISAVTSEETRTVRIGAVNLIISVAGTIGAAICGVLYNKLGFYGCYALTFSAYMFGVIYTYYRIHDPPRSEVMVEKKNFFVDFFDIRIVKDTLKTTFKDGARNRKKRVISIMILVVVILGPMFGESNVMYMYTRYKFEWDEIDFSIYSTYHAIFHIGGGVFSLMLFSKFLHFDDAMLGMLSSMSKILSSFVFAFAPNTSIFYLGAMIEMFNGTSHIAMRSIISKLVPANELGKVYSFFSICESLTPLIYGPMYSVMYKHTIEILPGAFFLIGGLLTIPSVIIFLWLHFEFRNDLAKDALVKKQEQHLLESLQSREESSLK